MLAFAYLAGITSINGALVGGMLVPASLVTALSVYMFKGLEIDDYTAILGGMGLIFTAIIHPEGIAPYFQPIMRHAGTGSSSLRRSGSTSRRYGPWLVGWLDRRLHHLAAAGRQLQQVLDAPCSAS